MKDTARKRRIEIAKAEDRLIAAVEGGPGNWWYLSFVDPDRPEGQRFVGGCYVQGHTLAGAVSAAWEHNCNPGGEIAAVEISPEAWAEHALAPENCYRLLSRAEVESL